jgi:uncharacterized membrane protein YdjX (TVP38/TMEM64 family)
MLEPREMKRLLVLIFALAILAFFGLHLNRYLTLDTLKSGQSAFESLRAASPWPFALSLFALYVAVAALPLPGAAILTLAAGALFGFTTGTVLVSFASSFGAVIALLASRYVLRDTVQRRFGEKLRPIDEGMNRDGAFYLFTLL